MQPGSGTGAHRRPRSGKTLRVWEIADDISREAGRRAKRSEVSARYVAEGGNPNTANTQYQYWKADRTIEAAGRPSAARPASRDVDPQPLRIAADGRLLLPVEIRAAMQLGTDGRVIARVEGGELRLLSPAGAIRQVQSRVRKYRQPGERVVDRFLAERRKLWGEA
jgi:bifunctional DNA-binding transcriptional regulator/antitoxin component of YhaV-PrlF toxin-antitoxin module